MKNSHSIVIALLAALAPGSVPAPAQTPAGVEALAQRMERLEQQNAELLNEVRLLRRDVQRLQNPPALAPGAAATAQMEDARLSALEEKLELQTGRLNEQDQIKVETSQRVPVRLTGMALFNLFANGRHGGGGENPTTASNTPGPAIAGATLRQSVIGLEFDGPNAVLGGKVRGSFLMDLFGGGGTVLDQQVRLRTASVALQWGTRELMVGQEKPILSPREPNSLAQVGTSPLTGAGNLWRWRPQIRFEQKLALGPGEELRARIGVSQTSETGAIIPAQFAPTLEPRRPALEGYFQFAHRFDDTRRVEIAPGFHWSTTHVLGTSVPSNAFSLDWFVNPTRRVEITGFFFTGKNLANLGAGGVRQGFTILTVQPNLFRVIPVRTRGGWAQVTFLATSRLSFNLYGGQDDPNNRDLLPGGIGKNLAYAANAFYRIAPNVVVGAEVSQVRTRFMSGERPLNNHYDLALAYLF